MENKLKSDKLRMAREEFAERQMYEHCKAHNLDVPNHIIKDAFRIGFDEGFKYKGTLNDEYIDKLWFVIVLLLIAFIAKCFS